MPNPIEVPQLNFWEMRKFMASDLLEKIRAFHAPCPGSVRVPVLVGQVKERQEIFPDGLERPGVHLRPQPLDGQVEVFSQGGLDTLAEGHRPDILVLPDRRTRKHGRKKHGRREEG